MAGLDDIKRANPRAHSSEAINPTSVEASSAYSKEENTLGGLVDQVVSEEHQAVEEHRMHSGRTEIVSIATVTDTIAGISDLIEYAVTTLVIPEGRNGLKTTDNRLQFMLQNLISKIIDRNLNSMQF